MLVQLHLLNKVRRHLEIAVLLLSGVKKSKYDLAYSGLVRGGPFDLLRADSKSPSRARGIV